MLLTCVATTRARQSAELGFAAALALTSACTPEAEVRAQWLLVVDTNAPIVSQLAEQPSWSDAAVDTLRVDVEGQPPTEFALPDTQDWPVSFGIRPTAEGRAPLVRLRVFRAAKSQPSAESPVHEPERSITMDRLVDLGVQPTGVKRVRVVMDMDCVGVLAQFGSTPTTCVDASRTTASPSEGVDGNVSAPSVVGSWPAARVTPCSAAAKPGRICMLGGYAVLGKRALANWGSSTLYVPPVPLRPVRLSPFWIDEKEYTVGRLREAIARGAYSGPLPDPPGAGHLIYCSWSDSSDPMLPLNCVDQAMAAAMCQADGGKLPTEARWEYTARGRGRGRLYPWGEEAPNCCQVAASRGLLCPGNGPKLAGVPTGPGCSELGDVSTDGVVDLAGNLSEIVSGDIMPYDDTCWRSEPVPLDPFCNDPNAPAEGTRGGDWQSGLGATLTPLRTIGNFSSHWSGFRCVYEDQP